MNNEEKILAALESQSKTLEKHSIMLEKHSEILEKHTKMLEKHSEMLEKHSEILMVLVKGQQQTNQRLDKLEVEVSNIKSDVSNIKTELADIKSKATKTDQRIEELNAVMSLVVHQQSEDFTLLQKVDKKIDALTAITHAHEKKFQMLKAI